MKMRLSIRNKLVLAVVALLISSSALVGIAVWKAAGRTAEACGATLANDANNAMDRLSRTLYERYGDVQAFAANRAAKDTANWEKWDDTDPLVSTMNDYVRLYGMYTATMLVDATGKVVAVNTLDPVGKAINTAPLRGRNFAGESWFKDAMAGRFFTAPGFSATGTVIDDIGFDEAVKTITGGDGLAIAFSAPVTDDDGKIIGVWRNVADFRFIEETLEASYKGMQNSDMPSVEFLLVDAKGRVWIDFDPKHAASGTIKRDLSVLGKLNLVEAGFEPAVKALKGELGYSLDTVHERKKESYAVGYAPRMDAMGFPGMPWGIIVRAPRSEALAMQTAVVQTVVGGLIVANIICAVGALIVVGWLLRPVRTLINHLKDVASGEGDLTHRLDETQTDEMGEVATQFNLFCGKMRDIVAEVMRSSDEVAAAATEISATTEHLLIGVREQHGRSTQVAAAVEESTASVSEVARRSAAANTSAEQAGAAAADGGREVQGTIGVIEQIAKEVEGTAESIGALGKQSEEIGRIATVINDIADQTNLLALNAAIEAARAGEHGRGFAVVADEVRKLAERTASATGEIASSIRSIQTESQQAVVRMQAGSVQVRTGVEQARRAGAALERIVSSAGEVAGMVKSIAATSGEQAKATEEIASAISSIAGITEQFGKSTEETAAACLQLSQKAESLRGLVRQFNTNRRSKQAVRFSTPGLESDLGTIADISDTGAQIIMRAGKSFSAGGENITIQSASGPVTVKAKQRWKKNDNGQERIGVEFTTPGSPELTSMVRRTSQLSNIR